MKTSLEKTGNLGRKLTIEVPAEKVSSAFDRVYKGIQQNATIKGFRKGKAPLSVIRNMYSDRVYKDVLEDLISQAYNNALDEHKLEPVSQPRVNFNNLDDNQPFNFTAEFEIRPDIELKKIEKLKLEKEKLNVSEEKVDSILTQIRESRSQLVPILEDRPAQENDVVNIDFVGTVEGKPLEGGTMNDYKLNLGSNSFIPGFESGIYGMKVGDKRELNLSFPADYHHKEIAGKPVKFDVTLKAILKKDLPEVTEEFLKGLGPFKTVDELKDVIRKDTAEEETRRINEDLKSLLLKTLVKENPVEVPQTLLEKQKEMLIADVNKRMSDQGMNTQDFEEYKQKWDQDFTDTATFMIQSSFLVETIAEKNQLVATKEEVEERISKYAQQSGIEPQKVRDFYLGSNQRLNQLRYQITEEKVVSFLLNKAEIKEVERKK